MDRPTAAQLAAAHLTLVCELTLLSPRSAKRPADQAGAVFQMERRRRRGGWVVEVWLTAAGYLAEPRPMPDHRLWVQEDQTIVAEDVDPAKRTRGRPRIHPPGRAQRDRLHITPADEDLVEVQRLSVAHEMTESAVGAALLAKALRGVKLPW